MIDADSASADRRTQDDAAPAETDALRAVSNRPRFDSRRGRKKIRHCGRAEQHIFQRDRRTRFPFQPAVGALLASDANRSFASLGSKPFDVFLASIAPFAIAGPANPERPMAPISRSARQDQSPPGHGR
jgi:hypothetical protein